MTTLNNGPVGWTRSLSLIPFVLGVPSNHVKLGDEDAENGDCIHNIDSTQTMRGCRVSGGAESDATSRPPGVVHGTWGSCHCNFALTMGMSQ